MLSQTVVRRGRVVMAGIRSQDTAQVPFINDEQVIQAFLTNRARISHTVLAPSEMPSFTNSRWMQSALNLGLSCAKRTTTSSTSAATRGGPAPGPSRNVHLCFTNSRCHFKIVSQQHLIQAVPKTLHPRLKRHSQDCQDKSIQMRTLWRLVDFSLKNSELMA